MVEELEQEYAALRDKVHDLTGVSLTRLVCAKS